MPAVAPSVPVVEPAVSQISQAEVPQERPSDAIADAVVPPYGLTEADLIALTGGTMDAPVVEIQPAAPVAAPVIRLPVARTGKGNATAKGFEAYRKMVAATIQAKHGVSLDDLSDVPLQDWYDAKITPLVAASRAIQCAGGEA